MSLESKLLKYAENYLNVMLIGSHGIGKSAVVKSVAEKLGMNFKYYSSSTLDPFAELIGIPVPDKKRKVIDFYRPGDLEDAEFIFFDELNRAHPRVLNTVLEIIQFKSINGVVLKNLKMVWAAINPPGGDYQVEDLDPALIDRFHCYVKMHAEINLDYMKTKMNIDLAKTLSEWWNDELSNEQQNILTPRRIEYLGTMIEARIPWRDAIPQGHTFDVKSLTRRIKILNNEEPDFILNKENILKNVEEIFEKLKTEPKTGIKIAQVMVKFNEEELFQCRELIEFLPKELVYRVGEKKFPIRKRKLQTIFENNNVDVSQYPKISEIFGFKEK